MQDDSLRAAFESTCRRLLAANWIDSYSPADPPDCEVVWTKLGEDRRFLLRQVIENFHLDRHVSAPLAFTKECHEQEDNRAGDFLAAAREFWIACLRDVDLPCEEITLWAFVQVLVARDGAPRSPSDLGISPPRG